LRIPQPRNTQRPKRGTAIFHGSYLAHAEYDILLRVRGPNAGHTVYERPGL